MRIIFKTLRKGFTLVELLVVIGIVGVLAAGVAVALDPIDKTRAANDAKVQQQIGTISNALKAYAAANGGNYPDASPNTFAGVVTALYNNGDLGVATITAPTGYTFTGGSVAANAKVAVTQLSKKARLGLSTNEAYFCHRTSDNTTTTYTQATSAPDSADGNVTCP